MIAEQIAHLRELMPYVPVGSQEFALRLISSHQNCGTLSAQQQKAMSALVRKARHQQAREFGTDFVELYA